MKKWHIVAILGGLATGFFMSKWPKGRNWGATTYVSGANMATGGAAVVPPGLPTI